MRVDNIEILMRTMAGLWPVSFPDAKRISMWQPQYEAVLGHLTGDELSAAYHGCMDGWTKKAAPAPADILKAHGGRSASRKTAANPEGKTLQEIFQERDAQFAAEKTRLIEEWLAGHPQTTAAAKQEGWMPNLLHQLAIGANILAQRNMIRLDPKRRLPFLVPEDAEYYGIAFENDQEVLTIRRPMIELWRSYRSLPPSSGANNFPHVEMTEAA